MGDLGANGASKPSYRRPGSRLRDCDGRVFTLATLPELLTVTPFPTLIGVKQQGG